MLAAVQIYNNPQVTFKAESFITLSVIGWTYLLHAFFRSKGIDYRYYRYVGKKKVYDKTKYGAYKHWELERCLNEKDCPLDSDTITNLRFLIGVRHEIEHQMTGPSVIKGSVENQYYQWFASSEQGLYPITKLQHRRNAAQFL